MSGTLAILCIEDDAHLRPTLERMLRRAFGAEVTTVASAEEAIKVLQERSDFDVVISDWSMGGSLNGGDVFAAVQNIAPHLISKFIFLSAHRAAEELCKAKSIAYIEKPGSRDIICSVISTVIKVA